jgi:hypothetical protein
LVLFALIACLADCSAVKVFSIFAKASLDEATSVPVLVLSAVAVSTAWVAETKLAAVVSALALAACNAF